MPAAAIQPRKMEGRAIRQELKELLAIRGRNARKGGDYYIVERDSGTYDQKVLMFHDHVLDRATIKAVQDVGRLLYGLERSVREGQQGRHGSRS
jgi:hypothetical protein